MSGEAAAGERSGRRLPAARAIAIVAVGAALVMAVPGIAARLGNGAPAVPRPVDEQATAKAGYGDVPLYFEANEGQTDDQVKFLARTKNYGLFLTPDKAVLSLPGDGEDNPGAAVHMSLLGANPGATVAGASPLAGKVNYLNNADPAQRRTNIPTFGRVAYSGVYPGIDLAYYGKGSQLEYDFVVAPGADPSTIRLGIEGADSLRLDDGGNLIMATAAGDVVQHKPVLYQDVEGGRRPVEGSFRLEDNQVGFSVGAYDRDRPLVIDPTLAYSTFAVGNVRRVALDTEGHAYVAGTTNSSDFPTTPGAFRPTLLNPGVDMAFVTKLNPAGSGLIYSTFIASTGSANAVGLGLTPGGSAWVTGINRFFKDVPVTPGAFLTDRSASQSPFVVKLSPDGASVVYGTYFAHPSSRDSELSSLGALAVDSSGDVWIAPTAAFVITDPPFPTTPGAVKPTCDEADPVGDPGVCGEHVILAKIRPSGDGFADLAYSTFLSGRSTAYTIEARSDGLVYVFGNVSRFNEPPFLTTPNALMPARLGGQEGFLAKVRPAGNGFSDLLYSSYIGGSGDDTQGGSGDMAVAPDGAVHVVFPTTSFDIPMTSGAFRPFRRDLTDIAVVRIDTTRTGTAGLLYSTLVPSDGIDIPNGIAVDGRGHIFVAGKAGFNLETRNPLACCAQDKGPQDQNFGGDAFVLELNPAGQGDADLLFSTFLGGAAGIDSGRDIALGIDTAGRGRAAYVSGISGSADFPVTPEAFRTSPASSFVSKIDFSDRIPCTRTLSGSTVGPVVVGFGEVVCLSNASVSNGLVVQRGGEARVQDSRVSGSITATQAAAFTLCGSSVSGTVAVTGTSPSFVKTSGAGCGPNQIRGTETTTTTALSSTTTTQPTATTTTTQPTTTTTQPTTTTTAPDNSCVSLRATRQAFNSAIDAAQAGQSGAIIVQLEQHRVRQNAVFDQRLAGCAG